MPRRTRNRRQEAPQATKGGEVHAYQEAYRQAREAGFTARDLTPAPSIEELRRLVASRRANTR